MNTQIVKIENYNLKASNGCHIRVATKVIFQNGDEIKFTEKMTKREAIKNAEYQMRNK